MTPSNPHPYSNATPTRDAKRSGTTNRGAIIPTTRAREHIPATTSRAASFTAVSKPDQSTAFHDRAKAPGNAKTSILAAVNTTVVRQSSSARSEVSQEDRPETATFGWRSSSRLTFTGPRFGGWMAFSRIPHLTPWTAPHWHRDVNRTIEVVRIMPHQTALMTRRIEPHESSSLCRLGLGAFPTQLFGGPRMGDRARTSCRSSFYGGGG
jgi:hypothetical protein